jgi:hypothetical protein
MSAVEIADSTTVVVVGATEIAQHSPNIRQSFTPLVHTLGTAAAQSNIGAIASAIPRHPHRTIAVIHTISFATSTLLVTLTDSSTANSSISLWLRSHILARTIISPPRNTLQRGLLPR